MKKHKKSYKKNKFIVWAPTPNDEFELPDVSYSTSDIQDNNVWVGGIVTF